MHLIDAVLHGDNAIIQPQMTALCLLVSSTWGVLWYREVRGWRELTVFVAAAVWTLAMVLLLAMEKGK